MTKYSLLFAKEDCEIQSKAALAKHFRPCRAFNNTQELPGLRQVFCHESLAKINAAPYNGEMFSASYIAP